MKGYLIALYSSQTWANKALKRMLASGYIEAKEKAKVVKFWDGFGIFGYYSSNVFPDDCF